MKNNNVQKSWMKNFLELLDHAIDHFEKAGSFDNKIAMISIDVTVESMIKTYRELPSSITNIKKIPKDKLDKIESNFPKLIAGLRQHASKRSGVFSHHQKLTLSWK